MLLSLFNQAISRPERRRIGYAGLFFAVVCLLIAGSWAGIDLQGLAQPSIPQLISLLISLLVTLPVLVIGLLALLVALVMFWGEGAQLSGAAGPGESVTCIRLFGFEVLRTIQGRWQIIALPASTYFQSAPAWSWVAFDQKLHIKPTQQREGASGLVQAALFYLLAGQWVELRQRDETYVLFGGWLRKSLPQRLYVSRTARPAVGLEGVWENKLYTALAPSPAVPDDGLELKDLVGRAFGESVSQPFRQVIKYVEREYADKGWGQLQGLVFKQLDWQPRPGHLALAAEVTRYQQSCEQACPGLLGRITALITGGIKSRDDPS